MPRSEQTPNIPPLRVAGFGALRGGWFWAPDDTRSGPTKAELVSIVRTRSAQIGVRSATINVQLDGQIGSKKEGLQGDEGGWQDKRNQGALFVNLFPTMIWRNL
jgi:hypothetical protein